MSGWIAAFTAFTASGLEFVEAATIVLAVAQTAGWRVALTATAWALVVLAVIAGVLGPALLLYVPIAALQIAVGVFLMLFGYSWLRKAIWRYAGRKTMRDEGAAFDREVRSLRENRERRFAFATAFNGVLLEGLEVAIIVVTFSAARAGTFYWAAGGALVAALLVTLACAVLREPLSRVPENAMGFIVGVMLLSFGTFWSGEGLGVVWWAGEATLAWIIGLYAIWALTLVVWWRRPVTR